MVSVNGSWGELVLRGSRIRVVVTDVDGVLTDAGVYYSARGEELKRFSLRDGMGVELLRDAGIGTAILTREDSPIVAARAAKLRLEHVFMGVRDKHAFLPELSARTGARASEMVYVGDDVNDLALLAAVAAEGGLAAAPADAAGRVKDVVHLVTEARGGFGAFREVVDWLLSDLRGAGPRAGSAAHASGGGKR